MLFDPYSAEFRRDPYRAYAQLRRNTPIFHHPEWSLTLFSRHRDVAAILRDRRFGRDIGQVHGPDVDHREAPQAYPNWRHYIRRLSFLDREGAYHRRLRGLVAKAFTKSRIAALAPKLEQVARDLLDSIKGEFELMEAYATPIPLTMIAELLAIPPADRRLLIPWSHDIVKLYELEPTEEMGEAAERATVEFVDYLAHLAEQRRADPGDDLLSALLHVEDEGNRLSRDELYATCILLLNAGHEATVHAIGNGVLALLTQRGELLRLRRDWTLLEGAVEETLRFDTPLHMFERWVLEDMSWDGHDLRAGEKVGLLMGAANRDPDEFDSPDRLDIARVDNHHVSFGGGAHFCLGAPLGRLELSVAFRELFTRLSDLEMVAEPVRRDSFIFRGIESLRLAP